MASYEAVIGLETHVQLKTSSKMFCGCPNRYGADPNTLVCPVCMGYPGVLPSPNRKAIRMTIVAGMMLSCDISRRSKFDRKSYFYPDMPKNYQLSQYDMPFCLGGSVRLSGKGFSGEPLPDKPIGITRIHLEEDVAKSSHLASSSGIDFNRAGVPLMEIVSEPDMRSPDEAYAYLTALKQAMQYAGISDCDMEKGQMRCDVNISLRPVGEPRFGTKVEIKNLNSFRSVHRSIAYEMKRQAMALTSGEAIHQETCAWNDDSGETFILRSKESAHDYRYFPEPDLMPVELSDAELESIRKLVPELPETRRQRYVADFGLTPYDAHVLTLEKPCAEYFEAAAKSSSSPKLVANWIISELLRELAGSGTSIDSCRIPPASLGSLVAMIDKGVISGRIAKTILSEMFATGSNPEDIVREKGLVQVSNTSAIKQFVESVIESNPSQVAQYREGKKAVLQYLVGQVMKASKGKANPQLAVQAIKDSLGE